ncbi:hypothetical protein BDQ17DRAFT_1546475 [Cyathus striatus]|nr:hypothetical protein BDQ17DRAFT_1546475 [Cyathus striatus]
MARTNTMKRKLTWTSWPLGRWASGGLSFVSNHPIPYTMSTFTPAEPMDEDILSNIVPSNIVSRQYLPSSLSSAHNAYGIAESRYGGVYIRRSLADKQIKRYRGNHITPRSTFQQTRTKIKEQRAAEPHPYHPVKAGTTATATHSKCRLEHDERSDLHPPNSLHPSDDQPPTVATRETMSRRRRSPKRRSSPRT